MCVFLTEVVINGHHPSDPLSLQFFLMFIFERQRQSMSRGGAEREGDTESEAGCTFPAVSTEPDAGLEPIDSDIMT